MKMRYWAALLAFIVLSLGFHNFFIDPYDQKILNIKNIPLDVTFVCVYYTDAENHRLLMDFYVKEFGFAHMEPLDSLVGAVPDIKRGLFRLPVQWRTAAQWGLLCQMKDKTWIIAPVDIYPSSWDKTVVVPFETLKPSEELPAGLQQCIDDANEEEKKFQFIKAP